MHNGWIKLHRKSLETIVFSNEKGWKVWTWCLMKACHRSETFLIGRQVIKLRQGQFVTGRHRFAEELGMSESTAWWWILKLEELGMINIKKTSKYSIITILKWNEYQEVDNKRTTNGQQTDTYKKNKNIKNNITGSLKANTANNKPMFKHDTRKFSSDWEEVVTLDGEVVPNKLDAQNAKRVADVTKIINAYRENFEKYVGDLTKMPRDTMPAMRKKAINALRLYSVDEILNYIPYYFNSNKKDDAFYASQSYPFSLLCSKDTLNKLKIEYDK